MGETIESVGAANETPTVPLHEISDPNGDLIQSNEALSAAMRVAVDEAMTLPGSDAKRSDPLDHLNEILSEEHKDNKNELLSGIRREGAPSPETDEEGVDVVAETLSALVQDLTVWHVTWGMAQTAQKDISHILKSS